MGLAVLLFFVVRGFVFRTANVDGNSMAPTLEHGDMVILNRFAYRFRAPRAGDIVAFPYPDNPSDVFIKRIIAVPGEVVDFRHGFFYVDGNRLDDDFSAEPTITFGDVNFPLTVANGNYFVLGDNRNGSRDSRFASVGNISACASCGIVGRARIRIWPLGRVGRVR